MPEIPQMERYRKRLDQLITGERIRSLHVQRESWLNTDLHLIRDGVIGRQILFIERSGTDVILHLDDGRRLLLRAGTGSRLEAFPTTAPVGKGEDWGADAATSSCEISHSQLAIVTDLAAMVIRGARSLQLLWLTAKQVDDIQRELGPDPLSRHLTAERFRQRFSKRRTALKTAFLNSNIISGIGSQFADDIAFTAGILPTVRTDQLGVEHWNRLFYAMLDVLHQAIEQENDLHSRPISDHDSVSHVGEARGTIIHGKTGKPCPTCGTAIEVTMIQKRPANFCTHCQINPTANDRE